MDNNLNGNNNSHVIRSDLEYIKAAMEKLNNKIDNTINTNQEQHSFKSTNDKNNLYDTMNRVSNKYLQAEKALMEKLQNEVKSNIAIGETYAELDNELEKKAGKL